MFCEENTNSMVKLAPIKYSHKLDHIGNQLPSIKKFITF